MNRIFSDLINGNLSDAKLAARHKGQTELAAYAARELGWSFEKAINAAAYLKGRGTFQAYCDTP